MTELQALGTFRARVAAPSPSARAVARDTLLATIRDTSLERKPRRVPPRRLGLALAAVAVVAVSAFAIVTLIDGAPGVIERAQAAIDPRWVASSTSSLGSSPQMAPFRLARAGCVRTEVGGRSRVQASPRVTASQAPKSCAATTLRET